MMFIRREPAKTVAVRCTHSGDPGAGADDNCLSTREWDKDLVDGAH